MPKYKYEAVDASGSKVSGTMEAASAVRVRNDLLTRELQVVQVKERKPFTKIEITTKKLKPVDLMNFSRQFAAFLRAGIPILDALDALQEDASNEQLRAVLLDISDALRSGSTLSDAMAAHDDIFPSYYIGILRSAELTGNLDTVLEQLAGYIDRDLTARRAVKSALTYPVVIMCMAVVTVVVLVAYVLPKFEVFFQSFDAKLPLTTRLLLDLSRFIQDWWPVILAVVLVSAVSGFLFLRSERGKFAGATSGCSSSRSSPTSCGTTVIERFFRILGSMLHAGVPCPMR